MAGPRPAPPRAPRAAAGLLGAACGALFAAGGPRAFSAAPARAGPGAGWPGAGPGRHGARGARERELGQALALAASGAAAALAVRAAGRRGARAGGARGAASEAAADLVEAAEQESGRVIRVKYDGTKLLDIEDGDVASMDAFMKENATSVCIQGVERIENGPGDDPSVKYAYLEPNEVGPFKSQMRLLLQVDPKETQKVEIHILEMWSGTIDKKTGEVTYAPEGKITFDTENTVTWDDNGSGGLKVTNFSKARSFNVLPWWFPVPDFIVTKVSQFFINKIISAGQKGVNTQIKEQYAAWRAK